MNALDRARRAVGPDLELRPARDDDSPGIVALIALCFLEFENCILDVENEERGLLTPSRSFGGFWVLLDGPEVVGTVGCGGASNDGRTLELKKLYLHPRIRGRRLATTLVALIEDHARELGAERIELWTDTRFWTAHRIYEHLGYRRTGRERELHDISETREFHYEKRL